MNRDFPQRHTGGGIVSGHDWLPHLCECGKIRVVGVCSLLTHTNTQTCTVCTFTHAQDYLTRWDWEPQCWKWQRRESRHLTLTFVSEKDTLHEWFSVRHTLNMMMGSQPINDCMNEHKSMTFVLFWPFQKWFCKTKGWQFNWTKAEDILSTSSSMTHDAN